MVCLVHYFRINDLSSLRNTVGQSIAVAHSPPRITLHSLQNGNEEHCLPIQSSSRAHSCITGLWWFKKDYKSHKHAQPDMFRRGNTVVCMRLSRQIYHGTLTCLPARLGTLHYENAATARFNTRRHSPAQVRMSSDLSDPIDERQP